MIRVALALLLYAGAFVFIYSAMQIDPVLRFPASEWSGLQWIAAIMFVEGLLLKLGGHVVLLSFGRN